MMKAIKFKTECKGTYRMKENTNNRETFGSRLGFILVSVYVHLDLRMVWRR